MSSEGCTNLLIITDCFNKRVILELCKNITAEWVTQTFIQHFYWDHELFITIVLNWDTQFVSSLHQQVQRLTQSQLWATKPRSECSESRILCSSLKLLKAVRKTRSWKNALRAAFLRLILYAFNISFWHTLAELLLLFYVS